MSATHFLRKYSWVSLGIASFFGVLIIISLVNVFYRTKQKTGDVIAHDVVRLVEIFQRIHRTCTIIDFDYQKNRINFLNVERFVGSEVGPMNLEHPERWEGPYLSDNPTVQDQEYQIVRTKNGYFITPGEGVRLPNGAQIGTDIIFDEDADIAVMMADERTLRYKGIALAAPLPLIRTLVPLERP